MMNHITMNENCMRKKATGSVVHTHPIENQIPITDKGFIDYHTGL